MVLYRLTMSLSVPAAGSGSTARPPGNMEGSPNAKGRPMGKKQECALPMGNSTLKTLFGAPATNDGCTDDQENELYGLLKSVLKEIDRDEHKKDSPGPLDWRKIHGDNYQEPVALSPGNHDNDDQHMEIWDDLSEDESSAWSNTSSMWDDIYADDVETFKAF